MNSLHFENIRSNKIKAVQSKITVFPTLQLKIDGTSLNTLYTNKTSLNMSQVNLPFFQQFNSKFKLKDTLKEQV